MRALQQTSLNGPQDLRLIADAPVPSPGPGEILIRVTAAGVNFVDISRARGTFAGGPQPPYLAGIEGAGEVAAIGEGVTGLESGAHVYLCGAKEPMSVDVENTLLSIIRQEGNKSAAQAESYLDELKEAGRFVKDVY